MTNQDAKQSISEQDKSSTKEIWKGIIITFLLHFLIIPISFVFPFAIFSVGIVQLLYMIPVTLYYYTKQKIDLVKGFMIGIGVTFALNVAFFAIIIFFFGTTEY